MNTRSLDASASATTTGANSVRLLSVAIPPNSAGSFGVVVTGRDGTKLFTARFEGTVKRLGAALPVWDFGFGFSSGQDGFPDAPEIIVGDGDVADQALLTVDFSGLDGYTGTIQWGAVSSGVVIY